MNADQDRPSSRRRRTNNLPGAGSGPANSGGRGGGGPLLTTGLAEGVFSMTRAAMRTNSASYQASAAADRNCRLRPAAPIASTVRRLYLKRRRCSSWPPSLPRLLANRRCHCCSGQGAKNIPPIHAWQLTRLQAHCLP